MIVFPCYPGSPRQPDPMFEREYTAAKEAGFQVALVETEIQFGGDALLRLPRDGVRSTSSLYRGWLLKPDHYQRLATALEAAGAPLTVPPGDYLLAYELPRWYEHLFDVTPRSMWFPGPPFNIPWLVETIAATFNDTPVILKDYLKSRKEDWFDACFIPHADDTADVERVVNNFLRIVGENLTGGLVFREFRKYRRIGTHPKSRMPLTNEYRSFLYDGRVIFQVPYWAEGFGIEVVSDPPDPAYVERITRNVKSRFFAADLAELEDTPGTWELIEINDGGAAGIPKDGDVAEFYRNIMKATAPLTR